MPPSTTTSSKPPEGVPIGSYYFADISAVAIIQLENKVPAASCHSHLCSSVFDHVTMSKQVAGLDYTVIYTLSSELLKVCLQMTYYFSQYLYPF